MKGGCSDGDQREVEGGGGGGGKQCSFSGLGGDGSWWALKGGGGDQREVATPENEHLFLVLKVP